MKTFKNILGIAVLSLLVFSCKSEKAPEVKTVDTEVEAKVEVAELDPNATYAKAEFTIEGMTCQMGCAKTIEKKMAKMEGVKSAKVDFGKKLAMVEYDEAKVTPNSLEEVVAKVGKMYEVKDMKTVDNFSSDK
ncbi:cation transporter [Winogradskyella sp. 3972H.M.0a.05]|uniref:heavy-metal-associated domain-containing protein n=1 Tax=Winogradskyella sp. 3972H.M.0a.05 TaxID=2950277 RepID=UPI003398A669